MTNTSFIDDQKFDEYLKASPSERRNMKVSDFVHVPEEMFERAFELYPIKESGTVKSGGKIFPNEDLNREKRNIWIDGAMWQMVYDNRKD